MKQNGDYNENAENLNSKIFKTKNGRLIMQSKCTESKCTE